MKKLVATAALVALVITGSAGFARAETTTAVPSATEALPSSVATPTGEVKAPAIKDAVKGEVKTEAHAKLDKTTEAVKSNKHVKHAKEVKEEAGKASTTADTVKGAVEQK